MKSNFYKKATRLLLLMALSLMLIVGQASAAVTYSTEITDLRDGVLTISGKVDTAKTDDINILVLNPGYDLEDAATDPAAIQQQWAAKVDGEGKFSYSFPFNTDFDADFEKGTFFIYVGGNSYGAPQETQFTFASYEKRLEYAKGVYTRATADGIKTDDTLLKEFEEYLVDAADLLGANQAFFAVDAKGIAKILADVYAETELDFADELPAGEEKDAKELAAITHVVNEINSNSVLEAFRKGKSEVLFDDANEVIVDSVVGLTERLAANTTLVAQLENITETGLKAINESMLGQDITDEDDLAKKYAKSIILYGIKNSTQMGYDYVSDLLTSKNTAYAGIEIPTYLSNSNNSKANSEIIKIKSSLTLSNMASKIESCSEYDEDDKPQKGSTTSGTGSISGGKVTVLQPTDAQPAGVFNDLAGYDWAKQAIEVLAAKNILAGSGDGSFNPGGQLTREQAVKIVCLALGKTGTSVQSAAFADEVDGAWYQSYLEIARAYGIANGQGDNSFGIGAPISREDFAVMLYRAIGVNAGAAELNFADADAVAEYAKTAVAYFAANKVINGYTDGTFKPKASISRAEASKLVYELIK